MRNVEDNQHPKHFWSTIEYNLFVSNLSKAKSKFFFTGIVALWSLNKNFSLNKWAYSTIINEGAVHGDQSCGPTLGF